MESYGNRAETATGIVARGKPAKIVGVFAIHGKSATPRRIVARILRRLPSHQPIRMVSGIPCHPVQRVASNLCFNPPTAQNPSVQTRAIDGFVPIHRGLNEASPVVARTTLPPDATILFQWLQHADRAASPRSYSEPLSHRGGMVMPASG
jgi:hypothetical protein